MKKNYQGTNHENTKKIQELENPRKAIMNQATQTINPITGKLYPENSYKEQLIRSYINYTDSSPIIESQKALAEMDLIDGKLPEINYMLFRSALSDLVSAYRKTGLSLFSITDASGLNQALRTISTKDYEVMGNNMMILPKLPTLPIFRSPYGKEFFETYIIPFDDIGHDLTSIIDKPSIAN